MPARSKLVFRLAPLARLALAAGVAFSGAAPRGWAYSSLTSILEQPGAVKGSLSYFGSIHSSADIASQGRTLDASSHLLQLKVPVAQSKSAAFTPRLTLGYRSQVNDAILPGGVPTDLFDVLLGADFLKATQSGGVFGLSAGGGFKTNRPFRSLNELVVDATAFVRPRSSTGRSGLLYLAQFSNNRGYLNWFPIPGLAYYNYLNSELFFSIGFPSSFIRYAPTRALRLEAGATVAQSIKAQAAYYVGEGESVIFEFRWEQDAYLLEGRTDPRDRYFIDEKTFQGGFGAQLTPSVSLVILAGVLFDKRISSQPSWLHNPAGALLLDPALFGRGTLRVSF